MHKGLFSCPRILIFVRKKCVILSLTNVCIAKLATLRKCNGTRHFLPTFGIQFGTSRISLLCQLTSLGMYGNRRVWLYCCHRCRLCNIERPFLDSSNTSRWKGETL